MRDAVDRHCLSEQSRCLGQAALPGVDGSEAEERQEVVRVELHRALQERLGAAGVAPLLMDDAAVDQALEVLRPHSENALEEAEGRRGLPLVEIGLAQEVRQLVVVAVELERRLESPESALDVESEEGVLRILDELAEELALLALEESRDPLLQVPEALTLLERQELVLHLPLPALRPLRVVDQLLLLEQLA